MTAGFGRYGEIDSESNVNTSALTTGTNNSPRHVLFLPNPQVQSGVLRAGNRFRLTINMCIEFDNTRGMITMSRCLLISAIAYSIRVNILREVFSILLEKSYLIRMPDTS